MMFTLKRNWKYILILLICLIIMIVNFFSNTNMSWILKEAIFNPEYRVEWFANPEYQANYVRINGSMAGFDEMSKSVFTIFKDVIYNAQFSFDVSVIFSTIWFQIIIPLFTVVSGIEFYKSFHSIFQLRLHNKKRYRETIIKEIMLNALKLAGAIFVAYFIFLIFAYFAENSGKLGADGRSLFSDLLGNEFYINHTFIYFVLEGLVRFFIVPFVYATLSQSVVLLGKDLKEVIAAPILYYYGLSAVGFALYLLVPSIAIYLNPSLIMASGSYEGYNSLLMIAINSLPLVIAFIIIFVRTRHVEV